VISFTLAIGELMGLLLSAIFWVAASIVGQLAIGAGTLWVGFVLVRRWRGRS
jgi:hypothetical protein